MAYVKKEIKFNKSMNADKRNENFAYLIKSVLETPEAGLYPKRDYLFDEDVNVFSSNEEVVDIIGTTDGTYPWVVVEDNANNRFRFYEMFSSSPEGSLGSGIDIDAIAFGGELNRDIYFVADDNKSYRVRANVSGIVAEVANFPSSPSVQIGIWDGLYFWWVGGKIWRQLDNGTPELVMSDTGFESSEVKFLANYENFLVIFAQGTSSQFGAPETKIFFYDKSNSTFFQKRIILKDTILLGGCTIDGRLMLVTQNNIVGSAKEIEGEINVLAWNGVEFIKINSIKSGRSKLRIPPTTLAGTTCKSNNQYMLLSVDDNDRESKNADLFKNYIYRIYKDGKIVVETEVVPNSVSVNYSDVVYVGQQYNAYNVPQTGVNQPKIYISFENDRDWSSYIDYNNTEYITNFYCNPFNRHKLSAFNVSFEKMFRNSGNQFSPSKYDSTVYIRGNIGTAIDIVFQQASDTLTPQNQIRYQVYKSSTNNISNIAEIELNGTPVSDWKTFEKRGMGLITITDVIPEETCYFNVIAMDNSGNKTAYSQVQITLAEEGAVMTGWANPTQNGAINYGGGAEPIFSSPTGAYAEDTAYARGDNSQESIFYGFGLSVPSGATILAVETRHVGYIQPNSQISDPGTAHYIMKSASSVTSGANAVTGSSAFYNIVGTTDYIGYGRSSNWASPNIIDTDIPGLGIKVSNQASASPDTVKNFLNNVQMRVIYK